MADFFEIPISPSPDATYTVEMENVVYDIRIRYNQRVTNKNSILPETKADEFTLTLSVSGEDPLFTTSLKTNRDLLRMYRYISGVPSGVLQLRDKSADRNLANGKYYAPERLTYNSLGTRFALYYYGN